MSAEDNKARHRQFVDEIFNKKNLELIPEFIAPGFVDHMPVDYLYGEKGVNFTAALMNWTPKVRQYDKLEITLGVFLWQHTQENSNKR